MSEPATTTPDHALTIGPPPDNYTGGPVTVLFQPAGDDREPDALTNCPTLEAAIAFAEETVENGFIHGALTFAVQAPPATALEQQVATEQAEYEAEKALGLAEGFEPVSTLDEATLGKIASDPSHPQHDLADDELDRRADQPLDANDPPLGAADLSVGPAAGVTRKPSETEPGPITGYSIQRIPPNAPSKTEHENLTLAQARELFKPMRCRGGAILRILNPDGQVVDTKQATLTAAPEPEPADLSNVQPSNDDLVALGVGQDVQDAVARGEADDPDAEASGSASTHVEKLNTDDDTPAPIVEPGGQTAILDPTEYDREDLQLPKVDGQAIDRIALKFTGTVFLDRADPADVALYRKLTLGHDITLMVEGTSRSTAAKGATNKDGELNVILGEKGVTITTVYIPAAAEDEAA